MDPEITTGVPKLTLQVFLWIPDHQKGPNMDPPGPQNYNSSTWKITLPTDSQSKVVCSQGLLLSS